MWVRKRFWKNGQLHMLPGETYHFSQMEDIDINPGGSEVHADHELARSRTFIPGKLDENRILMENDPTYKQNLLAMGPKMAQALLHGDPDAFTGDFFDDFSSDLEVEPFYIPKQWHLIGSVDPGWSSPCSFGLHARDYKGNIYRLFTYYVRGRSPQQHADAIVERIKSFPYTRGRMPDYIVGGRDAWAKQDKYAIVSHEMTFNDVFREAGLILNPAITERINGWWWWKGLMRKGVWRYFAGTNEPLIEELLAAQHDDKDPEDIQGRGNDSTVPDHALDECRYGLMAIQQMFKDDIEPDPYERQDYDEEPDGYTVDRPEGAEGV